MGKISQWSGTFTKTGMPFVTYSPKFLGSSLSAWFKADAGTTLSGSLVTGLADQSGNGLNLATSSANAYTLLSSMQNGLPGLENTQASGVARQGLVKANGGLAVNWEYTQPFTVIVAIRHNTPLFGTGTNIMFGACATNSSNCQGWAIGTGQNQPSYTPGLVLYNNVNTSKYTISELPTASALTVGSNYILQFSSDGTGTVAGITGRVNGVDQVMGSSLNGLAGSSIIPSNGNFGFNPVPDQNFNSCQDSFFETIVVKRLLTAEEKIAVDSYLNARWAIF